MEVAVAVAVAVMVKGEADRAVPGPSRDGGPWLFWSAISRETSHPQTGSS